MATTGNYISRRDIVVVPNKLWHTLQAFGSDESDKMATKRSNNRQIPSSRETGEEKKLQSRCEQDNWNFVVSRLREWRQVIKQSSNKYNNFGLQKHVKDMYYPPLCAE